MDMRADIWSAMHRHQRVAFQFSGGRDSTAALHVMRPFWDRLTVYHLDHGDQFPELTAVVDAVQRDTGLDIVRVQSDVRSYRKHVGMPSDVVPFDNTAVGRNFSGRSLRIVSRMECCATNLMAPLHSRVRADGMTLIVRGTRLDEFADLPIRSGHREDGFELLYPIEHWSAGEVDNYLRDQGLPVAPFYAAGLTQAPECMGCTAWWDDKRMAYLREHHPNHAQVASLKMRAIRLAIHDQMTKLNEELEHA